LESLRARQSGIGLEDGPKLLAMLAGGPHVAVTGVRGVIVWEERLGLVRLAEYSLRRKQLNSSGRQRSVAKPLCWNECAAVAPLLREFNAVQTSPDVLARMVEHDSLKTPFGGARLSLHKTLFGEEAADDRG
jgi:hypothetical protein